MKQVGRFIFNEPVVNYDANGNWAGSSMTATWAPGEYEKYVKEEKKANSENNAASNGNNGEAC